MMRAGVDVVRLNASHGTRRRPTRRLGPGARGGRARPTACVGVLLRPVGPEDPHRGLPDGPRPAGRRASPSRSTPRSIPRPATSTVVGVAYKDLPQDVVARRHAAAGRRPDRARRRARRRHAHRDAGARRRRAVRPQGAQPPGRRHLGAGADRQGSRGHPLRGRARASTTSPCPSRATRPTSSRRARWCARPAARRASSPRSSATRRSTTSPSIIEAADVVMVARGDLGVEMGYAELTGLQKTIIHQIAHAATAS